MVNPEQLKPQSPTITFSKELESLVDTSNLEIILRRYLEDKSDISGVAFDYVEVKDEDDQDEDHAFIDLALIINGKTISKRIYDDEIISIPSILNRVDDLYRKREILINKRLRKRELLAYPTLALATGVILENKLQIVAQISSLLGW